MIYLKNFFSVFDYLIMPKNVMQLRDHRICSLMSDYIREKEMLGWMYPAFLGNDMTPKG